MKIPVSQIKKGDRFVGDAPDDVTPFVFWTALGDAEHNGDGGWDVPVVHADGGRDWRCWASDISIEVRR